MNISHSSRLNRSEFETTHYLHAFIGDTLRLLAEHFERHTTINELRVGNYIGLMTLYEDGSTTNQGISDALGIPRSTVSRIVANFFEKRWIVEAIDSEDGRRRNLEITPGHSDSDSFERDFRALINELLQRFDAKKIVIVDSQKKSY